MSIAITVAIPTFNRRDDLRRCLESLRTQTGVEFEVVVVDDCGTDGTVEMLREAFPEVVVCRNERKLGPGHARNVALVAARGDIVLFLDSDTRMRGPTTLAAVARFFVEHPDTGTVGAELPMYQASAGQVFGRSIEPSGDSGPVACPDRPGAFTRCDFLATCCCAVKRAVAQRVGGFDPYFGFGGEDKDFGDRIARCGFVNYVSADCAVEHHHSPRGRTDDETYKYQRTRLMYLCKNRSSTAFMAACAYWGAVAAGLLLRLPLRVVVSRVRGRTLSSGELWGGTKIVQAVSKTLWARAAIRGRQDVNFLAPENMRAFAALDRPFE